MFPERLETTRLLLRPFQLADADFGGNDASMRVMEKIGMRKEGVLRQSRIVKGRVFDENRYSILRVEWQAQQ
jgi:RimJ/RimL family protein N-acetyltransferase